MLNMSVADVAPVFGIGYTGCMSDSYVPDLIPASQAMAILGIPEKSKPSFYDVLRRVQAEHGVDMRILPFTMARRAKYSRREIEAVRRQDFALLKQLAAERETYYKR